MANAVLFKIFNANTDPKLEQDLNKLMKEETTFCSYRSCTLAERTCSKCTAVQRSEIVNRVNFPLSQGD